jgi:peptidoglycan/LPS O-acetylase OafA/YrhL
VSAVGTLDPGPAEGGSGSRVAQAGELRLARVESLRALAALAVLFSHVFLVSRNANFVLLTDTFPHRVMLGGGSAVFLFFALTGYLLFAPFARLYFGTGDPIDLRRYALNRALRILPLYYFAVIVFLIIQAGGGSAGQWWRFLTFSENFFTSTAGTVDGPMWSLVVEVHFYILLPLLALGLARLAGRSATRAALVLVAVGAASFYLHWRKVDNTGSPPDLRWEYSLPATFFYFVPGMLLALLRVRVDPERLRRALGPMAVAEVWFIASLAVWALTVNSFKNAGLAAVASFLTVGACVLPLRGGPLVRALDWRPLAVVGVASYSLYLLHLPIVSWLHPDVASGFGGLLAVALPLCVIVALISYRLVEAPFLRLRRRWSRSSPAPAMSAATEAARAVA